MLRFDPAAAPRWLLLAVFAVCPLLAGAPRGAAAEGDNPWDREQRELAEQARREGRRPEGLLPVLELWSNVHRASAGVTDGLLDELAEDRRLDPARRAYVSMLSAWSRLSQGNPEGTRERLDELGYLVDVRVVGPFDNEGKAGFDQALPPEVAPLAPHDPAASYPGKEREVRWRTYPADSTWVGYVDLDAVFRPNVNACAFVETFIESPRPRDLTLWAGAGGAVRLWWNGAAVLEDRAYRRPDPDRQAVLVRARAGANRLLAKVCVAEGPWGIYLRVGDPRGGPPPSDLRVDPLPDPFPAIPEDAGGARPQSRPPEAPLAALDRRVEAAGDDASPDDLESLARLLVETGADDPAEGRARNLARQAADREPTVPRLLLASELAQGRGEEMTLVARAAALAPEDPRVLVAQARLRESGPGPEAALPLYRRAEAADPSGVFGFEAAYRRGRLLGELGLPQASAATIETRAARAPSSSSWVDRLLGAQEALGRGERVHELRERLVALRWNDLGARKALVQDALDRRDRAEARRHLDVVHTLAGWSTARLRWVAGIQEALGDTEAALEVLAEARRLAPEDTGTLVAHGELLLRLGEPELAAEVLEEALALRPQDAETRELLEQIQPEERFDEAYAVSLEALLERRGEPAGFPETILQDLTVNTVFDNGLGSRFRQVAIQIHDDEGARRWRTHSVQFDPGSQRVDIRLARVVKPNGEVREATSTFERDLGEPWYRIYYDTRALVVVFPDLEPGDLVEIRYRVDDVGYRNLFADYYGDLHFLQGFSPIRRLDYVLVTPASRTFHFNDPGLGEALRRETRRDDEGRRIDHFVRESVPALRSEEGMPGMTEVAPYLHVSTYRTWEDVGRWYWGLIEDQLTPDADLRETVAELVAGVPADDLREKVRRIHEWVVRNTRYVGLEFGIHGYKPYRVPLVVQRGFGDCKDKASLLYAMLEAAGVDARIVLVRTRRNGAVEDLPASLAVFDHAIAYVPALDRYIDGTAEHSGIDELPAQDQGVTVLVVGPDGAELTRTPVTPPEHDQRRRRIEVRLDRDGAAEVEVDETVVGVEAAGYRRNYQAEGTRKERFERELRRMFPGLVLRRLRMTGLDALDAPIGLDYEARVPQLARRDGATLTVPGAAIDGLTQSLARTPTRAHPLDLGTPSRYEEERTIVPPPGMRPGRIPSGGRAESRFGALSLSFSAEGDKVVARTELALRVDRVASGDYPAFREWVTAADRLLAQRIELTGGRR
jgi:transglutaminase-like putative cysteine protease/tetratricopeptide (TPR) repeat protein